jgi:Protein involved in formate dehydrogenase formation
VSADPASLETVASPWAARRVRAEELRARYPFSHEVLTLYLALLAVHEDAWSAARESPPHPETLPRWAVARVLPGVVEATMAAGPAALRDAVQSRRAGADHDALAGWLAGAELAPVDRYLARASLAPVLEALGERAGAACAPGRDGDGGVRCPCCGGRPQLSYLASSGESLVSGPRSLLCARCGTSWSCSRSTCPACGETDDARLVVHAEAWTGPVSSNGKGDGDGGPVFPQLRIAGCATCHRYMIEIDTERDGHAVPEVDELAALPLDLYAADQGLRKVTPNLMGF